MRQRGPHPLRVLLVLVTSLMLVVITMGGAARQANAAPPALIVGILHIGSVTDGGYNQAHAEGVRYMQKMLPGIEVIEVENVQESADAERVMETMIQRGAKLIIAASFGYLDPALNVAKRHPDVKFEHPSGYKLAPNLGTYWANTQDGFYLMGMAAGKMTKTHKAGFVVALPVSFFLANVNAFHLGARSVDPQFETRVVFTGTFLDPGNEATATNALLDQGADVMAMIVDSPITVVQVLSARERIRSATTTWECRNSRPRGGSAVSPSTGVPSTSGLPGRSWTGPGGAKQSTGTWPATTWSSRPSAPLFRRPSSGRSAPANRR